jgi:hypothetical protein
MADVARRQMMRATAFLFCTLVLFTASALAGGSSAAQGGTPAIALTGVKNVGEIWLDTLRKLPPVTITVSQQTDHGPVNASFTGALLWTVIDQAGWVDGAGKNATLRHTILVTGSDGYAAALSEGEIDPKLEGKQVILAYEKDGQPLDAPRLVVPGDAHAARSVHDVVGIDVR